jgi:hypothetical protein
VPYKWVVVVDETLPAGRAVNAAICVASATVDRTTGLLGEIRAQAVAQPGVEVVDMPTQAQHTRVYDDYLLGVRRTRGADLSYYAVGLFGPRKAVDKLVKGLGLFP